MGIVNAAGMWMNGSILKSERPASRSSTLVPGSAERRLAKAHPADPPPTITTSYRSVIASPLPVGATGGAVEPALLGGPDVVPDVLGLAVLRQTRLPELPAEPGLLVPAPLRLRHVGVVVVD